MAILAENRKLKYRIVLLLEGSIIFGFTVLYTIFQYKSGISKKQHIKTTVPEPHHVVHFIYNTLDEQTTARMYSDHKSLNVAHTC